ncbi:TPM domain-containing protein [uncultured Dokdonia sp.]|uniref:TPM domain-containing protein n=1 Tax=uncultured Dokdonia sp. TaxID=575653 RepID=UPI0026227E81|nr:TPM domain-containing protein [uncultured Dokdonia sp.]
MVSTVEDFLTQTEEQEIVEAIRSAESTTSGEIRVHLERHTDLDPLARAKEIFHILKMDNTKEENGVLIYIAVDDHTFAICGDHGIHRKVPANFWETTRDTMSAHFKKGRFKEGIIEGVQHAGERLSAYFPWKHGDHNELSNEITTS